MRALVVVLALSVAACGGQGSQGTPASQPSQFGIRITIAALDHPFDRAIAEVYAGGLEEAGYEVEVVEDHATLEEAAPPLRTGDVDLVVTTLDDAIAVLYDQTPPEKSDQAFSLLQTEAAKDGLAVLDFTPGARTAQFVTTQDLAQQLGVAELSGLQSKAAVPLTLAGPAECEPRRNCYEGLRTTYQLSTLDFVATDDGGAETFAALEDGEAQLAYVQTTDQRHIEEASLVALVDDQSITGPGNLVPLTNEALVGAGGDRLVDEAARISEALSFDALVELERAAESGDPAEAARAWLEEVGLTGTAG